MSMRYVLLQLEILTTSPTFLSIGNGAEPKKKLCAGNLR